MSAPARRWWPSSSGRQTRTSGLSTWKVKIVSHPLVGHLVERPGCPESREQPPVTVGGERHAVRTLQQDRSAVAVDRGQGPLHHEAHRPRLEAEVAGSPEAGARGGVVLGRGQHVPGQRAVPRPQGRDLRGVMGEQGAPRQRREGVVALGAVEAQTGPLPARQQHRRHLAPPEHLLAHLARPALALPLGVGAGYGDEVVRRRRLDGAQGAGASADTSSPTRRPISSRSRPSSSVRRRSRGSPSRRASASARWP